MPENISSFLIYLVPDFSVGEFSIFCRQNRKSGLDWYPTLIFWGSEIQNQIQELTLLNNALSNFARKRKSYPLAIAPCSYSGYVFCVVCGDSCEMLLTARDYAVKFMMGVLLIQADTFYYINVPFK